MPPTSSPSCSSTCLTLASEAMQDGLRIGVVDTQYAELSVSCRESRSAWARLIAKVYEAHPLLCRRCGSPMRILAVIAEPQQVRKILRHLINTGKAPPGLDAASLNGSLLPLAGQKLARKRSVFCCA